MSGDNRSSTIIFSPLFSSALSMARNIGYEEASRTTHSRNKYLPKRNEQTDPQLAPTKTAWHNEEQIDEQ
jgi:hypothetical protein